jgi:hypothetical protein
MDFQDYMHLTANVVNDTYKDELHCKMLARIFGDQGYVTFPNFFKEEFFKLLQDESSRLSKIRQERKFTMPGYETPRYLSVIGGKQILNNSFVFSAVYVNSEIKAVLSSVVNKWLFNVDHEEEFMVINFLEKAGGTHGWHVDDPQYALVIILQAPQAAEGGYLEVIPNWVKNCRDLGLDPITDTKKAVDIFYDQGKVKKIYHNTGDCYLLNAGDCLHRVAPITGDTNRVILNMAFDHRQSIEYGYTADILYGNKESVA